MVNEINKVKKFVLYVEEHLDVLTKSRVREQKQKKVEAAEKIINKWRDLTGKTLTQVSLFKKINNVKARAKLALNSVKPLREWQKKILEIVEAEIQADENHQILPNTPSNVSISDEAKDGLSDGKQLLNKYESDEAKLLTNEQLQRLMLLKQVKVLSLQQQRLERLNRQEEELKDGANPL